MQFQCLEGSIKKERDEAAFQISFVQGDGGAAAKMEMSRARRRAQKTELSEAERIAADATAAEATVNAWIPLQGSVLVKLSQQQGFPLTVDGL